MNNSSVIVGNFCLRLTTSFLTLYSLLIHSLAYFTTIKKLKKIRWSRIARGGGKGTLIHTHVRSKHTYEKSNADKIYFRRLINAKMAQKIRWSIIARGGGYSIHAHVRLNILMRNQTRINIFSKTHKRRKFVQFILTKREGQLHGLVIYSHKQISL